MPESSLQDLRDDWDVGDEVLVEYPGYGGATSSLRAGRIVDKESAFATVRVENGGNQKIPYKRLRQVAKPPRPVPNPQAQQQSLPLSPSVLRAIPPALASLAEVLPAAAVTAEPAPEPVKEQDLVKLPPRAQTARVIPAQPELELSPEPAPTPEPTAKRKRKTEIATWLENGETLLSQLADKERGLKEEANELEELRREVEKEAAEKLAALAAIQADIESFRKLRKFISTVRPNIPLVQAEQRQA